MWVTMIDGVVRFVEAPGGAGWVRDSQEFLRDVVSKEFQEKETAETTHVQSVFINLSLQQARKHHAYQEHEQKRKKQKTDEK